MSYVMSTGDFKNVHNSKCQLHSVIQRLDGIISDSVHQALKNAYEQLNTGLQAIYEQEDAQFQKRSAHYESISAENGFKSTWSMHEVDDLNDVHPFSGAQRVLYTDHWGEQPACVAILGHTWKDLYRAADRCIAHSGDDHHVFIEDFSPSRDDATTLILSTGS